MKKVNILHISEGEGFPYKLLDNTMYKITANNYKIFQVGSIELKKDEIYVALIVITSEQWKVHKDKILSALDNMLVTQIVIKTDKPSEIRSTVPYSRFFVMENPVHDSELLIILEKSILSAYYKMTAFEIGESCMSNVGLFEGIFELAKKERLDAEEEAHALQRLLDYETEVKKFQETINSAFEKLLQMKDSELLEMKRRIEATEKLDILREKELKEAFGSVDAIEKVLQYTRMEEMNLEKTIKAQSQLFDYTTQQVQDLIEENKKLKELLKISEK